MWAWRNVSEVSWFFKFIWLLVKDKRKLTRVDENRMCLKQNLCGWPIHRSNFNGRFLNHSIRVALGPLNMFSVTWRNVSEVSWFFKFIWLLVKDKRKFTRVDEIMHLLWFCINWHTVMRAHVLILIDGAVSLCNHYLVILVLMNNSQNVSWMKLINLFY